LDTPVVYLVKQEVSVDRIVTLIDRINSGIGKLFAWLFLPLTYTLVHEVVATKLFSRPTVWAFDVSYMLYGAIFMMGAAYTLANDGHVRGDMLYRLWSVRVQASIDLVLYLLVFFPAMVAMLVAGWSYAYYSFSIGERSLQSPFGPIIWPLKMVIPITAGLMLLQGVSQVIKCVRCLQRGSWS
jgi:TRAP-type mannitol/chloroaromatic compound transport system permease small subunit